MSDGWNSDAEDGDFREEFGVFDRVGGGGMAMPKSRFEKALMDPLEKFQTFIYALVGDLRGNQDINIDGRSIESIIAYSSKLSNIQFKNATAYVLGYFASGGGKNISKDRVQYAFKMLHEINTNSVSEIDVIRYARLWMTLV